MPGLRDHVQFNMPRLPWSSPSPPPSLLQSPIRLLLLCASVLSTAYAADQFPPSSANLTTIRSPINNNITISYKVPNGACETAFEHQRQYTGWVSVPGDYPINLFFWFVEARQPTESLTIWLNGGPGVSSLYGMFTEVGPCEVVERGLDEYETLAREWGWDRASNMLFVDQPNQVGFSYDTPTNGSVNLFNGTEFNPSRPPPEGQRPYTFLNGTFSSLNRRNTANTTEQAAVAVWHMLQGFLAAFPDFNPPKHHSLGVNLFAESYGGKYGPVFSDVWEQQNARRLAGEIPQNTTLEIHLTSLGIINGCIDDVVQGPYYPSFALDNTYGFQAMSSVRAELANASFYADGGCKDLIQQCRDAEEVNDSTGRGNVTSVNKHCSDAYLKCYHSVVAPYGDAGRSFYDIARILPDSFPPSTYLEYVNTVAFQRAIGAITNFTFTSNEVIANFQTTGDYVRGRLIDRLAGLLRAGIRIGLVYGDRDYICNWRGGEAAANAVAWRAGGTYSSRFFEAGYAPVIVNDSYIGGVVRQFANLSFSRIYQAGHSVPAYQPETAFQVFARIILGTSVSTGDAIDPADYASDGSERGDEHSADLPDSPGPTCWLRSINSSCNQDQIAKLKRGEGVVLNGVFYDDAEEWPFATRSASSSKAGKENEPEETQTGQQTGTGTEATTSPVLTGVYTATSTPDNAAPGMKDPGLRGVLAAVYAAFTWYLLIEMLR